MESLVNLLAALFVWKPAPPPWWLGVVTPAVSALLGAVFGAGATILVRLWFERRDAQKYRKAIYLELKDVQTAIATRFAGARHALLEFVTHRKITALPSEIMFPIYEKWFAEIVLQFTESERVALNHIYQKIRHLNWQLREQRQHWDVFGDDVAENETNLRKTVMLMEGAFVNAGIVDHMIGDLLARKALINVWDPKRAEALREREQYLDDEIRKMGA
jgi:hypothetical protein